MEKLNGLIAIASLSLALGACDYDKFPEAKPPVKDNVSFALDVQPILTAECATCHNPTEAHRIDIGMVLGPGLEFALKKKGAIQTRLLYTYGFRSAFTGMYYDSGMQSNNAAFLLQIGYLFN